MGAVDGWAAPMAAAAALLCELAPARFASPWTSSK